MQAPLHHAWEIPSACVLVQLRGLLQAAESPGTNCMYACSLASFTTCWMHAAASLHMWADAGCSTSFHGICAGVQHSFISLDNPCAQAAARRLAPVRAELAMGLAEAEELKSRSAFRWVSLGALCAGATAVAR